MDVKGMELLLALTLAALVRPTAGLRYRSDECVCTCPCAPRTYCGCDGVCTTVPGHHDHTTTTPTTTRMTTTTPTTTTTTPTTTTTTPTTTTTTPTTTTTTPTTTTTTPTTTTTTPTTTTTTPTTTITSFTVCNRRMDIAVVIDHSSFVRMSNFAQSKQLIVDALDFFSNIQRRGTRVAYFTFGRTPYRYSYLNQYTAWTNKRRRILGSRYRGNIPKIASMLQRLQNDVFTSRRGMRPNGSGYGPGNDASKVTVIMTDRALVRDRPDIINWSDTLKKKSTVIVIGMGNSLTHFHLHRLPTKPTYIFGLLPMHGQAYITPHDLADVMCNI